MTFILCLVLLLSSIAYLMLALSCDRWGNQDSEAPSAKDYLIDDLELDLATGKLDKEEYARLRKALHQKG